MNINKYRDLCRKRIRECRDLTHAYKSVLMRLVDYVNSDDFTAWPAFDTLADDVGVHRATVIRAVNVGRKLGLLKRIKKGGKKNGRGIPNRYVFALDIVAGVQPCQVSRDNDIVAGEYPTQSQDSARHSSSPATQSSNDLLNDNLIIAPPSASPSDFEIEKEEKKEVGEKVPSYTEIREAIRASWASFSVSSLNKHMRTYGPAKTLEIVECAARLGRPDINAVLDTPLMEWSAPQLIETEYSPELRALYAADMAEAA